MATNAEVNLALLRLSKRAESSDRSKLVETFVDVGPLFTLLTARDHQVIYGRRGTGKTHALLYLAENARASGDLPVYVDMRTIGSTGGIYGDASIPLSERATRLLIDTMIAVYNALFEQVLNDAERLNLAVLGPLLDQLGDAVSEVIVQGPVHRETAGTARVAAEDASKESLGVTSKGMTLGMESHRERTESAEVFSRQVESGDPRYRVNFGSVGSVLAKIADALDGKRVWLILDEWSVVPLDLQPYLADLLRRSVLPVAGFTVKIGAIEQRSSFQLAGARGDYIGVELGADVSADVNLDDFMVFENDAAKAVSFFQELLFKHYKSVAEELHQKDVCGASNDLLGAAFTQRPAFAEYVRAAEGVPRDAINILSLAAQRAGSAAISVDHVRGSARAWYSRDKEAAVAANPVARAFLHWIIDEVIGRRRARAFLLASNLRHELIDALFDARVLHLLKRNISAHDQPGVRYDVYKIDYGCYVDLLTTARAPQGLLPMGDDGAAEEGFVDVPPDDYRAIRRAILEPSRFTYAATTG